MSNGYHAGLVIPVPVLADLAGRNGMPALMETATRFRHYDWLEFGWGDAGFYRAPNLDSLPWGLAFDALAGRGSGSVLHVVGIEGPPEAYFDPTSLVLITVSPEGLERMAIRLEATFARDEGGRPVSLGPGLYGPSLFYRATGHFSLLRVCNHWVADLLDATGIPTTPVASLLPIGILSDLKWRSSLPALPAH